VPPPATPPAQTAAELTWSGIAKADRKDFAGAAADFNAALALRPDDADVVYNLGLAQSAQKDYKGAIAEFTRALNLTPDDGEILLSRGTAAFYLQDYDPAIADYERAIALNPKYTEAFYARALARRRKGNFDGAFADYDHALELDPNFWMAYNGRATTHNAHGDFALAISDYEKRIQLEPDGDEYAWFQRSLLLQRLGRPGDDGLAKQVAAWPDSWTKTVGQYLLGHVNAPELLRLAEVADDTQTRKEQECEANYYVGITALLAGRTAEAKEKFTACMATNVNTFLEYTLSRAELGRMAAAGGSGSNNPTN
jgi:tetratricopeptide (TPR) repeat protein